LRTLKKIYRGWEKEGGESYVRKGQNGRESLRRLSRQENQRKNMEKMD
jgi:hypothetical protein